ncbi:MAG: alpha-2-macroglobulin family protein [Planctomycetota bacterium]|jgi:uncharacterized protein YfaS (alpha-2-macroglobulin family)
MDFTETLYWCAGRRTDAKTGELTVEFDLSDAVTTFRVTADAVAGNGALGEGTSEVRSTRPFHIEARLPVAVSTGDVVRVPVCVTNSSPETQRCSGLMLASDRASHASEAFDLAPAERVRRLLEIAAGDEAREIALGFSAEAGPHADERIAALRVEASGYPVELAWAGVVAPGRAARREIDLGNRICAKSIATRASVCPSPRASLTESVKALSRQPTGCFSQTSSAAYLTVMAQQYFVSHRDVDPELIRRGREFVRKGYNRLLSFQSKNGGFEWFGGSPGNETLTAYGLMLFTEMSRLIKVSPGLLERTRRWLLSRRDGRGGFERTENAYGGFGNAPKDTADAYIVWALLEAGEKGLRREVDHVARLASSTKDSYIIALAANILLRDRSPTSARRAMERLASRQKEDGRVDGALTSATGSGGNSLRVETTALAVLAWLSDPSFAPQAAKGARFLHERSRGGNYGSTQATALALRAITAYDRARARSQTPGILRFFVDDEQVGEAITLGDGAEAALLPEFGRALGSGKHVVELRMEGGEPAPFSFVVGYTATEPVSSESRKLGLEVAFADSEITEGETTEATVTLQNLTKRTVRMPIAIVGVPGGLEPRHEQLRELVKGARVDKYEVRGRKVVLYWRGMRPNALLTVPISLVAAVPGEYASPASCAYPYYDDEAKAWVGGPRVTIAPRTED